MNAGSKVISGKVLTKGLGMDNNMMVGASSQRKMHNSRLDAMKRQFHKKVSRTSIATPQKNSPNTSPRKTSPY